MFNQNPRLVAEELVNKGTFAGDNRGLAHTNGLLRTFKVTKTVNREALGLSLALVVIPVRTTRPMARTIVNGEKSNTARKYKK